MAGLERLQVVVDAVAQIEPHSLPVAPAQLVDQLAAVVARSDALKDRLLHLRQRQHAMADVGGEARDGAVQMVAGFGVAGRLHPRSWLLRLTATGDWAERSLCGGEFSSAAPRGRRVRRTDGADRQGWEVTGCWAPAF